MAYGERSPSGVVDAIIGMALDAVAAPALAFESSRVTHANAAAATLFGMRASDLVGRKFDECLGAPGGGRAPMLEHGAAALVAIRRKGEGRTVVAELRILDGGRAVVTLLPQPGGDAEVAASRVARLQVVTALLSRALTQAEVAEVVVRHAVDAIESDTGGVLYLLSPDRSLLELAAYHRTPPPVETTYARIPLDSPAPAAFVARTGQPIWVETASDYEKNYPELAAVLRPHTRSNAMCVLPVVVAGDLIGIIGMGFSQARPFPPEERSFIHTLVEQCAQALDRARAYELERGARAEAEQARRAREEVLAVVAHDLKNPLGMVVLAASALARRAPRGEFGELVRRGTDNILAAADRMERLVHDLLDAASIEAGRLSLLPEVDVDLDALVDDVLAQQSPYAEDKRIRIVRTPRLGVFVNADRRRIAQVLANLASNAVKFTPEDGEVLVDVERGEASVTVNVSDTGPGIEPTVVDGLFERFGRGSGRGADTGLGLFIAKGIVEAHGGHIDLETRVGHGTRVSFTLPLR